MIEIEIIFIGFLLVIYFIVLFMTVKTWLMIVDRLKQVDVIVKKHTKLFEEAREYQLLRESQL